MKNIKFFAAVLIVTAAFALVGTAQTSLVGLDGSRVVILAVGASWLPLSREQAEYTNTLAKKYAGRDVAVYFVSTDSTNAKSKNFASDDSVKKFATTNKLNVTVLRDGDGAATLKKFNIDQIPSFVILDKNGNMVGQALGGIDPKYDISVPISKTVDRLL
jgi:thiol-disulfide isomerase/thioredoxin